MTREMFDDDALPAALWTPTTNRVADAHITRFRDFVANSRSLDLPSYQAMWEWSVSDLEGFWSALWDFFGLDAISDYDAVLAEDTMPGARWFTGSKLNFASYLLSQGAPDAVAIVATDETGAVASWTRRELSEQTAGLASTLAGVGVERGDVVVGYLPNIGEAVVAFLAVASLGAIWASVGQDYAPTAVIDRFGQLDPKVLVTSDGYRFNGRVYDRTVEIGVIQAGLPRLAHTIVVNRFDDHRTEVAGQAWSEAVATPAELRPQLVNFDHPLWVLFSSGTTGLPKGLVHGHGGVLVETLKQMALHWDLHDDDRLLWYTSPSWVVWNLQVSTLAVGGSIVCYDGSPTFPDTGAMWRLVSEQKVTFFGTSPGYLQASEAAGLHPAKNDDLSSLRSMGSTGSPLSPQSHRWAYDEVGPIPLWSMSGGTDVAGAFVGGAPTVPIWPGELSARCLGVALEAWDEIGNPVPEDEVGELVVRRPMPSMPVRLWDDPDGSRYTSAYFSVYPGAWRQGDWITLTSRGSVVIHGRSDSTLNRNGVRMGSADIYAVVDSLPGVLESLVIGAEQPDGTYWMPLFVVLADGIMLDDELTDLIGSRIREYASARHVPDEIIQVPGIPHTRTGKKLEVPVKRLLQGTPLDKVANPDTVDDAGLLTVFANLAGSRTR